MGSISRAPPAEVAASSTKQPRSGRSTHCATAGTRLANPPTTNWPGRSPVGNALGASCSPSSNLAQNQDDRVFAHYGIDLTGLFPVNGNSIDGNFSPFPRVACVARRPPLNAAWRHAVTRFWLLGVSHRPLKVPKLDSDYFDDERNRASTSPCRLDEGDQRLRALGERGRGSNQLMEWSTGDGAWAGAIRMPYFSVALEQRSDGSSWNDNQPCSRAGTTKSLVAPMRNGSSRCRFSQ